VSLFLAITVALPLEDVLYSHHSIVKSLNVKSNSGLSATVTYPSVDKLRLVLPYFAWSLDISAVSINAII